MQQVYKTSQNLRSYGRQAAYWRKHGINITFNKLRSGKKSGLNVNLLNPIAVRDHFKLAGFEYGNWLSQEERANWVWATAIALKDLEQVTGIKPAGLNGDLAIAFGARGRGGSAPAVAHYEPSTMFINLTKHYGINSLAHEYGHALDHYFGNYFDQDPSSQFLSYGRSINWSMHPSKFTASHKLRKAMTDVIYTAMVAQDGKSTAYGKRLSGKLGRNSNYWLRRTEIFARIFEQYVQYKLKQKGIDNKFLTKFKYEGSVYMKPAELKKIIPKMDKLMLEMRKALK